MHFHISWFITQQDALVESLSAYPRQSLLVAAYQLMRVKNETYVEGGTSSAGFLSKKLAGLNDTLIVSHGITYPPLSVLPEDSIQHRKAAYRKVFNPGNMVDS